MSGIEQEHDAIGDAGAAAALFAGPGVVRAIGRARDWSSTALGPVAGWSAALRTAAANVLALGVPAMLLWGPELIQLYNDGYAPYLGANASDDALGAPTFAWAPETRELDEAVYRRVLAGETVLHAAPRHAPGARGANTVPDDARATFAASPIGEPGAVIGVLVTAIGPRRDDAGDAAQVERLRLHAEVEAERARAVGILDSMADGHFVLDREYRFLSVNAAMERLVARSRDQLIGGVIWDLFPATRNSVFERAYRQVVEERREVHFTGDYEDSTLQLVPEVDAYPTAAGGIAVFWRDRAPRRRIEAELAASEHRFRTLADVIPTLAWTARADGYIIWYNARWYEYTGTTAAQMAGWGWQSVHDPRTLPSVLERWTASIASGEPFEMTFPLRGADGQFRQFLTRVVPLRDEDGRVTQWVGTNTDIEAERGPRAAAEAAEARLRDVFAQAPIAIAVLEGPEHVYTIASPTYAKRPGLGRQLIGRTVREVFPELVTQGYAETMDQVYQTGEPYSAHEREVFLVPPGGTAPEAHYYNVGYQPLRNASGEVYALASVAYDVTEHVRARREAEQARAEAERQRADAELHRADAEEANRAKSQFLSTMSHELRTPLNAIAGYAELLEMGLRGPITEPQRLDLERIRLANQHLLSLISDILNFARLEAGQVELHLADVKLDEVVADLEPLIAPQLAAKGLTFSHDGCEPDTPETPHLVRADREKLRQVLLNLLTNAVKFTESGGRVALRCETDGAAGVVRVHVVDTGRGIAESEWVRVFEPFVQVDRHLTTVSQQGVGLGLAISRDLARGMGGDLTVQSEVGKGSTFTLELRRGEGASGAH